MGDCLSKSKARSVQTKYLVSQAGDRMKTTVQRKSRPPLCVWVARGMPPQRPELSDLNKRIVVESWVFLRTNMIKIGTTMFKNLMVAVPAVERLFSKNSEMTADKMVRYHGELVMSAVDKAVSFLDDPSKLENFLHEVGDRHAEADIRIEYMDCILPYFIMAIGPALNEKWASSIEDAWAAFFRRVIHLIKETSVF